MNTRKYSTKQEKKVAKSIGGKKTANSGATFFQKGDIQSKDFCIECKTAVSEKESMSIKKEWILKIKEEAFAMNKSYWALVFNFGEQINTKNYYIIDETLFKQLINYIEKEEE
jgi:hypothetical protein